MITPCNFFIYDFTIWVLDTESPINICNSLQGLQVSRRFEEDERFFNVGDRRSVSVLDIEIIKFVFKSNIVVLDECCFCHSFLLTHSCISIEIHLYMFLTTQTMSIGLNLLRQNCV